MRVSYVKPSYSKLSTKGGTQTTWSGEEANPWYKKNPKNGMVWTGALTCIYIIMWQVVQPGGRLQLPGHRGAGRRAPGLVLLLREGASHRGESW